MIVPSWEPTWQYTATTTTGDSLSPPPPPPPPPENETTTRGLMRPPQCYDWPPASQLEIEIARDKRLEWRRRWHVRLKKLDRDLALAALLAVIVGGPLVWLLN